MNKRMLRNYEELAARIGLKLDQESGVMHGQRDGYPVMIYAPNPNYPYLFRMVFSVASSNPGEVFDKKELKNLCTGVQSTDYNQNALTVNLRSTANQGKLQEQTENALQVVSSYLRNRGYTPCCQTCGNEAAVCAASVGGNYMLLCDNCYQSMSQNMSIAVSEKEKKRENIVGGIVGALIGSLLGAACIILISQLGYVAAISGIVMAVCTLKGYELLGGRLTKKGIVISSIVMVVMTYIADRLDWAIVIMRELGGGFFEAYRMLPTLLAMDAVEGYYTTLAMVYLFVLVGAVPMVIGILRNQKQSRRTYRMG